MSQDASPGIAKGATTLRENSQSAQDWRPGLASWATLSRPFGTQFSKSSSHADSLAATATSTRDKNLDPGVSAHFPAMGPA